MKQIVVLTLIAVMSLVGLSACSIAQNADELALVGTWSRDFSNSYYTTYDKLQFNSDGNYNGFLYTNSTSWTTNRYSVTTTGSGTKVLNLVYTFLWVDYTNSYTNYTLSGTMLTLPSGSTNLIYIKQ